MLLMDLKFGESSQDLQSKFRGNGITNGKHIRPLKGPVLEEKPSWWSK